MFGKVPADVKRVGVVLSGGNIDPAVLAQLIEKTVATRQEQESGRQGQEGWRRDQAWCPDQTEGPDAQSLDAV
jgi:hypothetical protein